MLAPFCVRLMLRIGYGVGTASSKALISVKIQPKFGIVLCGQIVDGCLEVSCYTSAFACEIMVVSLLELFRFYAGMQLADSLTVVNPFS